MGGQCAQSEKRGGQKRVGITIPKKRGKSGIPKDSIGGETSPEGEHLGGTGEKRD